ncbi:1260_t:CDS:2 [Funneliformis caledonium]|uniref:1260_t:CDS:1 n=1 Tax=Funneliformis caledonium TaxID=1117310 RepID=A0A9N8VE57_9GLOM|nr:1260_t:CDS:2 [Funneliformis caledonium]
MIPRQILEIFTVQLKTEPKSLIIIRTIIAILLFSLLICYASIQINNVKSDNPVIASTPAHYEEKSIPLPTLHFTFEYRFTLTCQIVGSITKFSTKECATHLRQPESTVNSNGVYEALFNANGLNFTKKDIEKFEVTIIMDNPEEIPASSLGVEMRAFDSQVQDPLLIKDYEETNTNVIDQLLSLIDMNLYFLASQQYYELELSRIRKNVMVKKWWNILGIPSRYVDETYLNSILESRPYSPFDESLGLSYATLAVVMRTWRVPFEQEQITVNNIENRVGPGAIRSWGVIQRMKCFGIKKGVKKHMNRRYPRLPFIKSETDKPEDNNNKVDEEIGVSNSITPMNHEEVQIEILERIDAIERFLREFVVDAEYLQMLENHRR